MKQFICAVLVMVMVLSVCCLSACSRTDPTTDVTNTTPGGTSANPTSEPTGRKVTVEQVKEKEFDMTYVGEPSEMEHTYGTLPAYPTVGEHPRVMFTKEDIPTIKKNMTDPANVKEYSEYLSMKNDDRIVQAVLDDKTVTIQPYYIEAKAFAYAIEGDTQCGYEAILLAKKIMLGFMRDGIDFEYDVDDAYTGDDTHEKGSLLFACAEVYDWCYDLMTDEDRRQIYAGCQNVLAPYLIVGFPPSTGVTSAITSNGSEESVLRNWLGLAIAVYDEYPNAYDYIGGMFFAEYVPFRNYYYESDFIHQGSAYVPLRFFSDLYSAWLIKAMSGYMPYIDNMRNVIPSFAYVIRPDYSMVRMGDDDSQHRFDRLGGCAAIAASLFKDPVAKRLQQDYYYATSKTANGAMWGQLYPAEYLIINDPTIEPAVLSDLPLANYNGSPLGQMFARTGWDRNGYHDTSSDDIVVFMKIGETAVSNHDHLDSGSFQIYYKGALAIDSSTPNDLTEHRRDTYRTRTIAHNALLIYGKKPVDTMDWGGQRFFQEAKTMADWSKKERTFGKVTGHEFLEENKQLKYAYIAGDITAAYYSSAVKDVQRSMLFVPTDDADVPGLFFVFDKITSKKAEYEKVWLLHMREEPTLDGNITTITRTSNGDNGKLVNQTLLPKDPTYRLIGGDGQTAVIDGVNISGDTPYDPLTDVDDGWGRLEVATVGNETDYFFNVMTIGAADTMIETPPAVLIETDTHAGTRIMDYVAVFSKKSERETDAFEFRVYGTGTELTYCIANMAAGTWTVSVDGTEKTVMVTEDGGFAYFTAPAGNVTVTPNK